MKVAVVEHRLRGTVDEDVLALCEASIAASDRDVEVVFYPFVLPADEHEAHTRLTEELSDVPGTRLIPRIERGVRAQVFATTDTIPIVGARLGSAALLHGDACFNPAVLERTAATRPAVLVMTPMSESELQAEAVVELGIRLSESVAGLVVIAEPVGAAPGEGGHGGSAIILLGEVLAESLGDGGDLLVAEVPEPVPLPEPPEPIPEVPTILAQRLATHEGRHLDMGYLADLSSGAGPR